MSRSHRRLLRQIPRGMYRKRSVRRWLADTREVMVRQARANREAMRADLIAQGYSPGFVDSALETVAMGAFTLSLK